MKIMLSELRSMIATEVRAMQERCAPRCSLRDPIGTLKRFIAGAQDVEDEDANASIDVLAQRKQMRAPDAERLRTAVKMMSRGDNSARGEATQVLRKVIVTTVSAPR